jgi:hypothetical protein
MRQSGKLRRPCTTRSRSNPRGPARDGGGGILAIVLARNEAIPARPAIRVERPPPPHETVAFKNNVIFDRGFGHRNTYRFSARFQEFAGNATCNVVVDSDHREIGIFHQLRLDRGIIFHRAVAVQVIWRDIQKYARGWIERGRESDLKRRALDDMNALLRRRRQCEDRDADIAAHLDRETEASEKMRDERRRRGFPIVPW